MPRIRHQGICQYSNMQRNILPWLYLLSKVRSDWKICSSNMKAVNRHMNNFQAMLLKAPNHYSYNHQLSKCEQRSDIDQRKRVELILQLWVSQIISSSGSSISLSLCFSRQDAFASTAIQPIPAKLPQIEFRP